MSKRKARNKAINKVDTTKPLIGIDLFKLGSENDPCFGKLYDPKDDICRRCGDIEVCAIAYSQNNHKLRKKAETTFTAMDMEEMEIDKMSDTLKAKKLIRRLINNHKVISIDNLKLQVEAGLGITGEKFEKILTKVLSKTDKFVISGKNISLK